MTFYCIRHMPTAYNKKGILQGQKDIDILPVTAPMVNAEEVRDRADGFEIYTSSLVRTQQTAETYGFFDYYNDPLLDELDFGRFEGCRKTDLVSVTKGGWVSAPFETELLPQLLSLQDRIDRFIASISGKQASGVLAFGHGAWTRLAYASYVLGDRNKMNSITIENGEMIQIL